MKIIKYCLNCKKKHDTEDDRNRENTKMKYKAYLTIILVAILLVTMTACGSTVASRPYD